MPARPAGEGDLVRLPYVGTLEDGSVFSSSEGREPLEFEVGAGEVLDGLDAGVRGMRVGEQKWLVVPPEEGYGSWRGDLLVQVDRGLAGEEEVLPGMAVQVRTPEDEVMEATVTEVGDDALTLGFNTPSRGRCSRSTAPRLSPRAAAHSARSCASHRSASSSKPQGRSPTRLLFPTTNVGTQRTPSSSASWSLPFSSAS